MEGKLMTAKGHHLNIDIGVIYLLTKLHYLLLKIEMDLFF